MHRADVLLRLQPRPGKIKPLLAVHQEVTPLVAFDGFGPFACNPSSTNACNTHECLCLYLRTHRAACDCSGANKQTTGGGETSSTSCARLLSRRASCRLETEQSYPARRQTSLTAWNQAEGVSPAFKQLQHPLCRAALARRPGSPSLPRYPLEHPEDSLVPSPPTQPSATTGPH